VVFCYIVKDAHLLQGVLKPVLLLQEAHGVPSDETFLPCPAAVKTDEKDPFQAAIWTYGHGGESSIDLGPKGLVPARKFF